MEIKEKFKNCDDIVLHCLKNHPKTRGSDRELIRCVWEQQGYKLPKKHIHLYYMVHKPETITRSRRTFQAKGLFRPDQKTRQKRLEFAEQHRKHFKEQKKRKAGYYEKDKWIVEE